MSVGKMTVWQPSAFLLKGDRIYSSCIQFNGEGLKISLTDKNDSTVNVIYCKGSNIVGDYVWSFRYINEISASENLVPLMKEAIKQGGIIDTDGPWFYKFSDSNYLKWHDKLGHASSKDVPELEHHLFPVADGILEVISDYEPIIMTEK